MKVWRMLSSIAGVTCLAMFSLTIFSSKCCNDNEIWLWGFGTPLSLWIGIGLLLYGLRGLTK